jgi:F-type H+-transporting ATPase subunit delta
MQASDRLLAQRYARALFNAAEEKGQADSIRQQLTEAARQLRDHLKVFQHPLVPIEEKKQVVRKVLDKAASPLVLHFLDVLIDKKRWSLLPLCVASFDRILDADHGVVRAQVRAARPLSDAQRDKLRAGLENFSGKKVQLELKEDPSLLGGVVVRMGDWVLDASLLRRLAHLRDRMVGTESI